MPPTDLSANLATVARCSDSQNINWRNVIETVDGTIAALTSDTSSVLIVCLVCSLVALDALLANAERPEVGL